MLLLMTHLSSSIHAVRRLADRSGVVPSVELASSAAELVTEDVDVCEDPEFVVDISVVELNWCLVL